MAIRKSKTGKPRHVILTDEGAIFSSNVQAGRAGNELIFTRANGTPWKASQQGRPMREACERAKIKPVISFHGLRHTWASLSVMAGVPLMVVARNLGHVDTRMVEKHYGHLAPSFIVDAIRAGAPKFGLSPSRKVATLRGEEAVMVSIRKHNLPKLNDYRQTVCDRVSAATRIIQAAIASDPAAPRG